MNRSVLDVPTKEFIRIFNFISYVTEIEVKGKDLSKEEKPINTIVLPKDVQNESKNIREYLKFINDDIIEDSISDSYMYLSEDNLLSINIHFAKVKYTEANSKYFDKKYPQVQAMIQRSMFTDALCKLSILAYTFDEREWSEEEIPQRNTMMIQKIMEKVIKSTIIQDPVRSSNIFGAFTSGDNSTKYFELFCTWILCDYDDYHIKYPHWMKREIFKDVYEGFRKLGVVYGTPYKHIDIDAYEHFRSFISSTLGGNELV